MFLRVVITFSTLLSLSRVTVTDGLTIHLDNLNDRKYVRNRSIIEGDSLNFEAPDTFSLRNAWCHDFKVVNGHSRHFESQPVIPQSRTISFSNVSTNMSTSWICTLDDTSKGPIDFKVNLNVTKRYVNITSNGKNLGARLVDLSLSENDYAEYRYQYRDGEIVNTGCINLKNVGGIRMEYKDANNKTLFIVKDAYVFNPNFRSLMKLERNNSFLDCIYTPLEPSRKFVFRTYFIMKERVTRKNYISVLVNGLELVHRQLKVSKNAAAEFQYYYINGELLTVECRVHSDGGAPEITSFTRNYNGTTAMEQCRSADNCVEIKFESELTPVNFQAAVPRISGLQANNILYQYTSGANEWTIHYQYTSNETLNLACNRALPDPLITQIPREEANFDLKWAFRGKTLTPSQYIDREYNIKQTNWSTFKLEDVDNMGNIICSSNPTKETKHREVQAILILHNMSPPGQKATDNDEITTQTLSTPTLNEDEANNMVWYIVGATLTTVFLVVVVCVPILCRYMKTKIRSRYDTPYYENYNEDNIPIPVFPSQWNEYAEPDSHYTKIDEGQMLVNNYYQGIIQDRSCNESQHYYTEIIVPATEIGGNSKEYAEVMRDGDPSHQRRNAQYSNILSGGRYANTSASADYAEPAYCSPQLAVDARPVYVNSSNRSGNP